MDVNNPIDPVNPTGLFKPLTDTELEKVKPLSGGISFLWLAALGLAVAGLALAPQTLPTWLMFGGFVAASLAFNGLFGRAKALHKRVGALSQALAAQLARRTFR